MPFKAPLTLFPSFADRNGLYAEFYNFTGQLAANRLYFVLSGGLQTATVFIGSFVSSLGSC